MSDIRGAVNAVRDTLNDTNANVGYVTVHRAELEIVLDYADEKLGDKPTRPFKVGDKVQEICENIGDDLPVGVIISQSEKGNYVVLESSVMKGRTLLYFDDEIEPYAAVVEAKFKVGQKVEILESIQASGAVVKAGTQGTVVEVDAARMHEFEVMFSGATGTFSVGFDADELKADLAIGDEVEVVAEHMESHGRSLIGDRGTLIKIEPHADTFPYSVEFRMFAGLGSQVKYFARTELKKV